MATTVAQHQVSAITDPADGSALSASVMRGVSSTLRSGINAHDADPGVHLQSSVAASRPAAGEAGRKWLDTDTLLVKYDTGSTWSDLAYLKSSGGTVTGAVTISSGGLTVSADGITVTGNSTITGTLGGLTGLTMASGTLAAVDLTVSGTFTPAGFTSNGNLTFSGTNRRIVPGTTSLAIRNVGNTRDAIYVGPSDVSFDSLTVSFASSRTVILAQNEYPLATNTTLDFAYISHMSGAPTGTPAGGSGAIVIDGTNNRLYVRIGNSWKYATLS